ncbi:MAG: S41 family peptidase [bacterium]|nr:S41 family peptidase [bacterium]
MKIDFIALRNTIVGVLLVILGGVVGFKYAQTGRLPLNAQSALRNVTNIEQPTEYQDVSFSTFWEVWGNLERDYLYPDKIQPSVMVDGATSGLTSSLGDPYTVYLPPVQNQRSGERLAGAFYGVGIELGYIENVLAVIAPLPDSPAQRAGIQASDLILRVKDEKKDLDEETTGWSLDQAVNNIRGERGTSVTLTLFRESSPGEPIEVTMQRDEIITKTVELNFVEHQGKRVAHIKLSGFGERTEDEWNQAVAQVLTQKNQINGIILDMRNNPGGFFDGAIDIASDFIEDGTVVTQKGKVTQQDFTAQGRARLASIPLEVLVNRGSASASEIVAGALRDQLGAKLIGEKTFGKGTVQDRRELSNGGGLHVTIAQWLLPKGASIQDEGIPVDVEVQDDLETEADEVLNRAIEEL